MLQDAVVRLTTLGTDDRIRADKDFSIQQGVSLSSSGAMDGKKESPSRFRSLRDSVTHITKRLTEGETGVAQRNDEHIREVEKLRVQIQSMEEEIRRLYQSRYQLDQATKQNEKLVTTLQEAKVQIEALRAEVEKLTAPPSAYAIFSSLNADGTGNVYVSGRKMKVSLHPSINGNAMRKGQEVVLNEALNVIEVKGFDVQGEVVRLKDVLEGNRALVTLHFDEEKVAELGDPLLVERLSVGDHLLYDPRSGYVVEKLPRSEAEELVLEEVPDVDYEHIGGLQHELEQVRDAVELQLDLGPADQRDGHEIGRLVGIVDDQRHPLNDVVKVLLLAEPVVAQIVAVIGSEHDQRIFPAPELFERIPHAPEMIVEAAMASAVPIVPAAILAANVDAFSPCSA